jgi:glycine oxidase
MRVRPHYARPLSTVSGPALVPVAADVVVIGGGVIGSSVAAALADTGCTVALVRARREGGASRAAAGMLAPSIEPAARAVYDFSVAARDQYPAWLEWLEERTGIRVALNRRGILQPAASDYAAGQLRSHAAQSIARSVWLEPRDVARREPALARAAGALFHAEDGAVDNVRLMDALEAFAAAHRRIREIESPAIALDLAARSVRVRTEDGRTVAGEYVVVAAGAWTPQIAGVPRRIPVTPVRGQMLALDARPLQHVIFGSRGYLVPRGRRTLVGSTMEKVGFAVATTERAQARLRGAARAISPSLARARVHSSWAGLRPVTPDMLPILGPDPDWPRLIWACGHSRNGILHAPITGEVVAALVAGKGLRYDLRPFQVTRSALRSSSRATRRT